MSCKRCSGRTVCRSITTASIRLTASDARCGNIFGVSAACATRRRVGRGLCPLERTIALSLDAKVDSEARQDLQQLVSIGRHEAPAAEAYVPRNLGDGERWRNEGMQGFV